MLDSIEKKMLKTTKDSEKIEVEINNSKRIQEQNKFRGETNSLNSERQRMTGLEKQQM